MATLHIRHEPDPRRSAGASIGGRYLNGMAEVRLTGQGADLRDIEGRDLLNPDQPARASRAKGGDRDVAKAAKDIAAFFGPGNDEDAAGRVERLAPLGRDRKR